MNIEKLEKLKKSLDNKFIPDNMKDKIRAEIKKLEADIKTDDTMTTTEIKSEVKEIEKEVEKALEVAEKKEEKAEAKTRAKRTTTSRTKKPKVEEKPTAKKKTVFSLAKEIRKADESWDDAKQRARKMMTSQTTETKKKTRTETDKLLAMVRRNKEYKKLAGTSNLSKDAQRRAMPRGKRVSESGNVYYENRANRVDVGGFKSAYLETGGGVGKMKKPTLKKGDVVLVVGRRWFDRANGNTYHTAEVFVNDKYVGKSRMTYGYDEQYIQTAKEILLDSYKLPKGMSDTSPLWQLREYGVTLNKTVSDGLKRDLETGGTIIGTPETPLGRDLGIRYTGLVGETGAMSSGEMFMAGGSLTKYVKVYVVQGNYGSGFEDLTAHDTFGEAKKERKVYDENERNYPHRVIGRRVLRSDYEKGNYEQGGSLVDGYLTDPNFGDFQAGIYEMGGNTGLPSGAEQSYVNYYLNEGATAGMYKKGGVTNERRYVNKSQDYEVRYAKSRPSRKGYKDKRNFASGGGIEDNAPSVYIADLEAYNNGRLVGKWFNLLDYSDADEFNEAVADFLKETGAEEYAVHDFENIPRSMQSEYLGVKDFEKFYEMIDLARDKDLPLEVVMEVSNELGESAVDEFYGVYDSEEDFAQQLVDDLGIESFNNFEYYLEISDTDRRLLAQEMADSYVDDIRDEDGGNRLIEEANLDLEEYEEADSDRQEEMLDEAREIVYDEYYNTWYDGLDDPYYFLVEEQGLYSADDFAKASFVRVDIEKLARELEYDYTFIRYDGKVYVFSVR